MWIARLVVVAALAVLVAGCGGAETQDRYTPADVRRAFSDQGITLTVLGSPPPREGFLVLLSSRRPLLQAFVWGDAAGEGAAQEMAANVRAVTQPVYREEGRRNVLVLVADSVDPAGSRRIEAALRSLP